MKKNNKKTLKKIGINCLILAVDIFPKIIFEEFLTELKNPE